MVASLVLSVRIEAPPAALVDSIVPLGESVERADRLGLGLEVLATGGILIKLVLAAKVVVEDGPAPLWMLEAFQSTRVVIVAVVVVVVVVVVDGGGGGGDDDDGAESGDRRSIEAVKVSASGIESPRRHAYGHLREANAQDELS